MWWENHLHARSLSHTHTCTHTHTHIYKAHVCPHLHISTLTVLCPQSVVMQWNQSSCSSLFLSLCFSLSLAFSQTCAHVCARAGARAHTHTRTHTHTHLFPVILTAFHTPCTQHLSSSSVYFHPKNRLFSQWTFWLVLAGKAQVSLIILMMAPFHSGMPVIHARKPACTIWWARHWLTKRECNQC